MVSTLSESQAQTFQTSDDAVFIGYINPKDAHLSRAFHEAAERFGDRASFAAVDTKAATSVACFNNREGVQATLPDLTKVEALPDFIDRCMAPVIGEFTRTTESKFLQVCPSCFPLFSCLHFPSLLISLHSRTTYQDRKPTRSPPSTTQFLKY
jgi:hypothetical protein